MSANPPENLKNRCLLRFLVSHMTHLSYLLFRLLVPMSRKSLLQLTCSRVPPIGTDPWCHWRYTMLSRVEEMDPGKCVAAAVAGRSWLLHPVPLLGVLYISFSLIILHLWSFPGQPGWITAVGFWLYTDTDLPTKSPKSLMMSSIKVTTCHLCWKARS